MTILFFLSLLFQPPAHLKMRQQFEAAYKNESVALDEIERLKGKDKSPLEAAYLGAILTLMADHSWNPIVKLSYFNEGREILDKAVESQPDNAEIRYLRFMIQNETPKMLGYKTNLETDIEVIRNEFEQLDKDLKNRISSYMRTVNDLSAEDKENFKP